MGSNHDHGSAAVREGHQKKLIMALALTGSFMIAEVIGAWITGSLALLSDASHMFTDTAALAISLIALQIAKRPADQKRTFGYARLEILASTFNAVLLFLVAMYILYEAYQRFFMPAEIATGAMMWIAIAGLIINLISMRLLASASNESLNVKGLPRSLERHARLARRNHCSTHHPLHGLDLGRHDCRCGNRTLGTAADVAVASRKPGDSHGGCAEGARRYGNRGHHPRRRWGHGRS